MEENIITSVQNTRVKHVVALQQKSSLRREEGLFVVEGQREIEHCVACGYEVVELYKKDENVSAVVYEKMAYRGSTEGMIAVVKCKEHTLKNLRLKEDPLIVVLESVEKPGNLGAVLRTAEAAGVDAVIVCDPLTDVYNPNVIRASIGGVFCVPTAVCSSEECIAFLKAHQVQILTAQLQDSYEYYDYDMRQATAIVMGTESTGLSQQWREAADAHIRIPMLGRLDSLNVSVSAAILMYEAVRQRKVKR
jgi:TrmH family RNA methyltransferase